MTDRLTPQQRSGNMSKIRSRDTGPEIAVRKLIHSLGFRFRLHDATLPGRPDIVLKRHRCIIQVHGCFWHQHTRCVDGRIPSSRQGYWREKLTRNVERDLRVERELRELGWRVITIWECEVGDKVKLTAKLVRLLRASSID